MDNRKAWLTTLRAHPAVFAWETGTNPDTQMALSVKVSAVSPWLQNTYKGIRLRNMAPLPSIPQGKEKDSLFDGEY